MLKLICDGSVMGGGMFMGGKGCFDLKVVNFDLNVFVVELWLMCFGGLFGVMFVGDVMIVDFNLNDLKFVLGVCVKVVFM